jgi:hypothetical protein
VVSGADGMIAAIMVCLSSDPAPPSMTGRKPRNFYTTKNLIKGGFSFFPPQLSTTCSAMVSDLAERPTRGLNYGGINWKETRETSSPSFGGALRRDPRRAGTYCIWQSIVSSAN